MLFRMLFLSIASYVYGHWYKDPSYQLPQRKPTYKGYSEDVQVRPGNTHQLVTLSVTPPIFQIKDFLTADECDKLISVALNKGLLDSPVITEDANFKTTKETFTSWDANNNTYLEPIEFTFIKGKGDLYLTEYEVMVMLNDLNIDKNNDNLVDFEEFKIVTGEKIKQYFIQLYYGKPHLRSRLSKQAWLWNNETSFVINDFKQSLSKWTLLPEEIIETSEPLQIVRYDEGGHYHCHHDSDDYDWTISCCTYKSQDKMPCRQCRYITVMFFLNDAFEGGETAFQVANNETFSGKIWEDESIFKCNLADNCHASNLIIQPTKGTAIMWYNHQRHQSNGWLGNLDQMTYHGGCDVISGNKWIANSWINIIGDKGSRDSYSGWTERPTFNKKNTEL